MKTNYNISTNLNGYDCDGNGISLIVENTESLFRMVENLAQCLYKKYVKFGGLDLAYLEGCSTLKAITRAARKEAKRYGEYYTMSEDLQARKRLVAIIFWDCEYMAKNK